MKNWSRVGLIAGIMTFVLSPLLIEWGNESFFKEEPLAKVSAIAEAKAEVAPKPQQPKAAEAPKRSLSVHTVVRGDTLIGLYGSDWRKVADGNALERPYTIRVGQHLVVPEGVRPVSHRSAKPAVAEKGFRTVDCSKKPKGFCEWTKPGGNKFRGKGDSIWALTHQFGFTQDEAMEAVAGIEDGQEMLIARHRSMYRLSFGKNDLWEGKIILRAVSQKAMKYVTKSGKIIYRFEVCGNWAQLYPEDSHPMRRVEVSPPPTYATVIVDEPKQAEPVEPKGTPDGGMKPLSAFPVENELEWELIAGAGVWDNNLAHGQWQYAEGAITKKFGDGYSAGLGFFGMQGRGESETSAYTWKEHAGFGPQLVLKRNFSKEQEFDGVKAALPAGWSLKLRWLPNDYVDGGNPDSGYHMTQRGQKLGLYGEYFERTSPDWIMGATAEVWDYRNGRIQSTWAGDKPQDRGNWNANAYAQYRIDDDWQARGILGVSHQNWDELNYLNAAVEMRWKETIMFGPRLSLALNKPEAYRDVSHGDLTTLGAFIRAEFGGLIRVKDREEREESVSYVGPVTETSADPLRTD